jgi:hypothetical protein
MSKSKSKPFFEVFERPGYYKRKARQVVDLLHRKAAEHNKLPLRRVGFGGGREPHSFARKKLIRDLQQAFKSQHKEKQEYARGCREYFNGEVSASEALNKLSPKDRDNLYQTFIRNEPQLFDKNYRQVLDNISNLPPEERQLHYSYISTSLNNIDISTESMVSRSIHHMQTETLHMTPEEVVARIYKYDRKSLKSNHLPIDVPQKHKLCAVVIDQKNNDGTTQRHTPIIKVGVNESLESLKAKYGAQNVRDVFYDSETSRYTWSLGKDTKNIMQIPNDVAVYSAHNLLNNSSHNGETLGDYHKEQATLNQQYSDYISDSVAGKGIQTLFEYQPGYGELGSRARAKHSVNSVYPAPCTAMQIHYKGYHSELMHAISGTHPYDELINVAKAEAQARAKAAEESQKQMKARQDGNLTFTEVWGRTPVDPRLNYASSNSSTKSSGSLSSNGSSTAVNGSETSTVSNGSTYINQSSASEQKRAQHQSAATKSGAQYGYGPYQIQQNRGSNQPGHTPTQR